MKLSISKLRQIIKEELGRVLRVEDDSEIDPEKRKQAEKDGRLDFKDDADRGDYWEFEEPKYLEFYQRGYDDAAVWRDKREYDQ